MTAPTPEQRLVLTDADLDELMRYVDGHDWAGLPFAVDRIAQRAADQVRARAERAEAALARVAALAETWAGWGQVDSVKANTVAREIRAALNGADA